MTDTKPKQIPFLSNKSSVSHKHSARLDKSKFKRNSEKLENEIPSIMCQNLQPNGNIDELFHILSIEDVIDGESGRLKKKSGLYKLCRFCGGEEESVEHIISKCPILAPIDYKIRHDKIAKAIHWCLCGIHDIDVSVDWSEHVVSDLTETVDVKIFWNYSMLTYKKVAHNRPDIVLVDKRRKRAFIIEVGVSRDHLVTFKEKFKKEKYEELAKEIEQMWHVEVTVLPVIVGALGNMREYTRRSLAQLQITTDPLFLQQIAFTETIFILRRIIDM